MLHHHRYHRSPRSPGSAAFSVIELIVSIALVSMLLTTLGFALFHTRAPIDDTRTSYSQRHLVRDVFGNIARQLTWATQVITIGQNHIACELPAASFPEPDNYAYYRWVSGSGQVLYGTNPGDETVVAENVADLEFTWETVPDPDGGGDPLLASVRVTVQLGPDADSFPISIPMINNPPLRHNGIDPFH